MLSERTELIRLHSVISDRSVISDTCLCKQQNIMFTKNVFYS
ncbi:hypothetical protein BFO_3219 [Tannerella forsythia 92A2]|uniref:Uncharacterized protein n=1 Tax=Tannerella forsythia (strain ATCC 43037 / JCM 10827 / CCUG 21028 A / KCTC 5666 / FDC 338) TaxID=203275 RepID=G8UI55_TANFA|nr:hypothetical protein BFO_3219 [Tannerella forsythia 92A2]